MKPYPAYKDSGVEWIGDIPSEWDTLKLKYMSSILPSNVDKHIYPDEIQVRLCNYTDVYYNEFITPALELKKGSCNQNEFDKFRLRQGDVIITKDSESADDIGIPTTVTQDYDDVVCGYHLTLIRAEDVLGGYLFRFIQSDRTRKYFEVNSDGVTRFGLGKATIENMVVPFSTLPEQQQISNYLDNKTQKIDILIEKTQQKIELLKEQRTTLINHVVTKGLNPDVKMKDSGVEWIGEIPSGWEIRRIWSLGNFSKGRGIKKDEVKQNGIPCIRYGEIYTSYERVLYSPKSFIDEDTSKNSEPITKGNVLFTASGELLEEIGKAVVYYGDDTVYAGGDIIILQLNDDSDPLFISYLMNSYTVNSQKTQSGRGGIIVHIYSKQLNEVRVTLPPLQEQQQIVEHLDKETTKIDTLLEKESQRIELLKEYRQSLISEVVTGKVDVREEVAA